MLLRKFGPYGIFMAVCVFTTFDFLVILGGYEIYKQWKQPAIWLLNLHLTVNELEETVNDYAY
jgi:hypothetical protein